MSPLSDTQLRKSRKVPADREHTMFVSVAQKVGANAALVYSYLHRSLCGQGCKKPDVVDGVFWTTDSQFDMLEELLYLSQTQLIICLTNLQLKGLIIKRHGGKLGEVNSYTLPKQELK